jgi:hypothetical protein
VDFFVGCESIEVTHSNGHPCTIFCASRQRVG